MGSDDWRARPIRMGRFEGNLPVAPKELEQRARMVREELHVNFEWVIGAPGLAPGLGYMANFQTERFEVNPAIGKLDPIRSYAPVARKKGITLFAYMNMHWYACEFADRHPDWEQRLSTGEAYGRKNPLYGSGTTFCVNSGWRAFAFDLIEEAMRTGIDGVFLDGPVVYPGCCYCEACREKFRSLHEEDPPGEEDWNDPGWKRFLRFREGSMAEFLREAGERVRRVNPGGGIFCNAGNWSFGHAVARNPWVLEEVQDLTGAEAFFHLRKEGTPYLLDSSMAAKFLRAGRNPAVVFTHHMLGVWHFLGLSRLELKRAFFQSAACGANNWFAVFDPALERMPEKTRAPVAEAYGFLEAHEEIFTGAVSAARTALVHARAASLSYLSARVGSRGEVVEEDLAVQGGEREGIEDTAALKQACDVLCSDEFSGFFYNLTRNHVPFEVVRDQDLAPERLEQYSTVILPNAACLGSPQRTALLDFVRRGGRVIGSFEAGLYDEEGVPVGGFAREMFGIEEVEGVFEPADFEEYLEIGRDGERVLEGFATGELVPRFRLALQVRLCGDAQVLARIMEPIGQLYGHLRRTTPYPGIVLRQVGRGRAVYLAGSFGDSYHHFAFLEYEQILASLLGAPQIVTDAPSTVQMELWRQEGHLYLHLVNNSGDMRRPMKSIHPVDGMRIELPGIRAGRVRSARGERVEMVAGERGVALRLPLKAQYDIVVIEE